MTDALDRAIELLVVEIAEKEQALENRRAELGALRRAAEMRPSPRGKVAKGKVTGTLSAKWRAIMRRVVAIGNEPCTETRWQELAAETGFALNHKAVQDWLHRGSGARMGYIECVGGMFRVSPSAVAHFGFVQSKDTAPVRTTPMDGEFQDIFDRKEFQQ